MKYEMIFGDEKLFDGAHEDAVIAIKRPFIEGVRSEKSYFFSTTFDAVMMVGSLFNFNDVILKTDEYAERRIIKEPKHWTWEDKKVGRLPEVGCKVLNTDMSISCCVLCEVIHVNADVVIVYNGELSQTYPHAAFVCAFNPSETPAERAQREEDEFVSEHDESSLGVVCMDSSHRKCYELGKRVAYRKLKEGVICTR